MARLMSSTNFVKERGSQSLLTRGGADGLAARVDAASERGTVPENLV